jgi:DNA invertase Pin-like site-specific DNA recombinase
LCQVDRVKRGYARVSRKDQNLSLQLDALNAAGCERMYADKLSGARDDRPELQRCIEDLKAGDVLVVWRLDRLGRSLQHLLTTVEDLAARGIGFESLHDKIDTTNATGKLVFHILAALAEFERALTIERIEAGLTSAKARGTKLGRKAAITEERATAIRSLIASGMSVSQVARSVGVSRATLYRYSALTADPQK